MFESPYSTPWSTRVYWILALLWKSLAKSKDWPSHLTSWNSTGWGCSKMNFSLTCGTAFCSLGSGSEVCRILASASCSQWPLSQPTARSCSNPNKDLRLRSEGCSFHSLSCLSSRNSWKASNSHGILGKVWCKCKDFVALKSMSSKITYASPCLW